MFETCSSAQDYQANIACGTRCYPAARRNISVTGSKQQARVRLGYNTLQWLRRLLKGFYRPLLLLAEAAAAAQGYLVWPANARSDEQDKDDWFMSLER